MRFRTTLRGVGVVCALALGVPAVYAATINVGAGGDLQAAINAAVDGDVITLAPGAIYVGNFTLPAKAGVTHHITIRSAASDAQMPPLGVRMRPEYAAFLPKIKSPNSTSALRTASGAHHWKLLFLEFQANQNGYGDIISLGAGDATQTMLSQVPYQLVIDRVYVHGDPVMGQKRGIALNSRDTTIANSYVSDCKAVGQDSQAIGGWNGAGNFLIENNYLEAAAENFLMGGADPAIPNLVPTNITFRRNYLTKPLSWRDPIVPQVTSVTASASATGGMLPAGNYYYTVVARMPAGQTTKAVSVPSKEVMASVTSTNGAITVSWAPVNGASDYLVYGRTAGAENVYWRTTNPFFTDTGANGTSGKPAASGTKWAVKNVFELKNAQDVLVEGNVIEHLWVAAQRGYPVLFTPRNQSGTAPWTIVQRVTFRYNVVRHAAGGVNILGTDDLSPSQITNNITVQHNVFDDINSATWGVGARVLQIGDGGDAIAFDHNTIITTTSAVVWLYGGSGTSPTPITNVAYTNNMSVHNSYGIDGSNYSPGISSINAYLPGAIVRRNVIAGANSSHYPADNFYPTVAAWQASFVDYGGRDYHLTAGGPYSGGATDGTDLGADIDRVSGEIANATSGDNTTEPGASRIQITTASLPDGQYEVSYAQALSCTGGKGPCAWELQDGLLPNGLVLDAMSGTISGVPTAVQTTTFTVMAHDPSSPANCTTKPLSLTVQPPPFSVTVPPSPSARVGAAYQLAAAASGAMGTSIWSVATGALPPGLGLDPAGVIFGMPTMWGTYTAVVQAQDSWDTTRSDSKPVTIIVAPLPISIPATSLPAGRVRVSYQTLLSAVGGTGSTIWAVAGGALPKGLALVADGTISGVPEAVGTFAFTVQATDAGCPSNAATQSFTITVGAREIVLYATDASVLAGTWSLVADTSAAGGYRVWNPDLGATKVVAPLASPANYFEVTFEAEAGVPYHFWLRGKADRNSWANDSIMFQFSDSVDANGAAIYRIGTTSGSGVNLENCSGCGLSGWGWQDNGWGVDAFGPDIYFAQAGTHTLRVQVKEDGLSIDQIVLSAGTYLTTAPGASKNDATILQR